MTHDMLKKRLAEFGRRVSALTGPLLKSEETHDEARQLRRAANGISSNYRAAALGRSHKEFTAKLGVAFEEADECAYWLEHVRDTGLVGGPDSAGLLTEGIELTKILAKSYRTASNNDRPPDGPLTRRTRRRPR